MKKAEMKLKKRKPQNKGNSTFSREWKVWRILNKEQEEWAVNNLLKTTRCSLINRLVSIRQQLTMKNLRRTLKMCFWLIKIQIILTFQRPVWQHLTKNNWPTQMIGIRSQVQNPNSCSLLKTLCRRSKKKLETIHTICEILTIWRRVKTREFKVLTFPPLKTKKRSESAYWDILELTSLRVAN